MAQKQSPECKINNPVALLVSLLVAEQRKDIFTSCALKAKQARFGEARAMFVVLRYFVIHQNFITGLSLPMFQPGRSSNRKVMRF